MTPAAAARRPGKPLSGKIRNATVYLFVALLLALARPTPVTLAAGLGFLIAGEAVRLWAAGHLVKSVQLITSGPYAYVQHPLYLGRLLLLTGFCLAARMPYGLHLGFLGFGYAVFFLYYFPRKLRVEGRRLQQRHPEEWRSYSRQVPLLFPTGRRYAPSGRRWAWRRAIENQELYFLSGVVAVLGFLVVKMRLTIP